MSWFARLMYRALVWKERQRARKAESGRQHPLETGERGETLAYWYLRQAGYILVARNWRARRGTGELDLIGWDGATLAFVEVKTRTSCEGGPPEAAVVHAKQKRVVKAAKEYLRRLRLGPVNYRFDIVSVFWERKTGYQVRLIKDAFKER